MICNYSKSVWQILIGMVVTGAARSIAVKLTYQSGFTAPLTITLLYLLGQALSLFVYAIQQKYDYRAKKLTLDDNDKDHQQQVSNQLRYPMELGRVEQEGNVRIGSSHGLDRRSDEATRWVQFIPNYAKPILPALFNLMNSALRWISLIYVAASIAEMLISGTELVLSVIAARIFRKRNISRERWLGVGLVTVGIILIGLMDYLSAEKPDDTHQPEVSQNRSDVIIGIILIICQSILSVLQDISEEIFMQVEGSEFPATLMLGVEGAIGLSIGLIVYFSCGKSLGEDPSETLELLRNNHSFLGWIVGLPFLFLVTGIFNIRATEVTSSMTRNVWKNLRTALVWIFALLIFYVGGNDHVGEAWIFPDSMYILLGFIVMTAGIVIYYSRKKKEAEISDTFEASVHSNAQVLPCTIHPDLGI